MVAEAPREQRLQRGHDDQAPDERAPELRAVALRGVERALVARAVDPRPSGVCSFIVYTPAACVLVYR